ncbi:MAG: hypothetical protein ACOZAA_10605 [Pseudomonadota bacterium]
MRIARIFVASYIVSLLAACATTPPPDPEEPSAGIRREPCGGGPVFPPEDEASDKESGEPEN